MAFFKKYLSLFKLRFIAFSVLKLSLGGQNQVLLGVKIECCLGSKLSTSTQSQCLCGCTQFRLLVHSSLTQGSTHFLPSLALDFDPQGLFSKLKISINHNFKRDLDFLKKVLHLIIFPRFLNKKLFFNLGILLSVQFRVTIQLFSTELIVHHIVYLPAYNISFEF